MPPPSELPEFLSRRHAVSVFLPPLPEAESRSPTTSDSRSCRGYSSDLPRTGRCRPRPRPAHRYWPGPSPTPRTMRRLLISNDFTFGSGLALGLLPWRVGPGLTLVCTAPWLQPHYRTFFATMSRPAPVPRLGTLPLAVSAARGPPSRGQAGRSPRHLAAAIGARGSPVPCQRLRRDSRHLYTGHRQGSTQATPG